jgi:hypothetical protein
LILDLGTRALHAFDVKVRELGTTRAEIYAEYRREEALLLTWMVVCNTTDQLEYLWDLRELVNPSITFRVADRTPHVPTHSEYMRMRADNPQGYIIMSQ